MIRLAQTKSEPLMKILRVCFLISGGGTTMLAILRAIKSGRLKNVMPACVISSKAGAKGIAKAAKYGVACYVVDPKDYKGRKEAFGKAIIDICKAHRANFCGQYGWLPLTPKSVIEHFKGMMTNQHPGAVRPGKPGFGGRGMQGTAVAAAQVYFARRVNRIVRAEATAQLVHERFDEGRVIVAREVPIRRWDTPKRLQKRMLPIEWDVQIQALEMFSQGEVTYLNDRRPLIHPGEEEILAECKALAIKNYP